jgi:putative spermidine/putrescine transport system ATP-binding protein
MSLAPPPVGTLELRRVSRSFGAVDALREVDLTIRRGEFVALLGPSGSGKSTTLNCVAGLLAITGGRILLDGRRIDGLRPEQRGFGMVFQNYALFPHMTVRQNVGFGLRMRGVGKAETARRVDEAVRLVRLEGQGDKLPEQLSGGQQQRVALARAVVIQPPLVLMDEPLSNLDVALRLEMRAEIRRIHSELGATTIYVTHDQDEALSMADRVVVLRDGAIRQVGPPPELYERPADLGVAIFMGFRNRIEGLCRSPEAGRARLRLGEVELEGIAMGPVAAGANVVAVFRPDDVVVDASRRTGLPAQVETLEYRGREFVGTAMTDAGLALTFCSSEALRPGDRIGLAPDPARMLLYPTEPARA